MLPSLVVFALHSDGVTTPLILWNVCDHLMRCTAKEAGVSQTVNVCSYPQLAARTPLLLLPTVYKFNYFPKVPHWLILMGEEAFALAGVGDSGWTLEPDDQLVSAGPREKRHCTMSDSWQTLWRELWLTVLSCLSSLQLSPPSVHSSLLLAAWTRDPAFDTMDPSECEDSSASKNFIEEAAEFLQHASGRDDLRLLLTEEGAWEAFVAEAELSRTDADTLRDALNALTANMGVEDQERLQRELQDMERFVDAFPQMKLELEGHIRKLRALADKVDKVHRDCTISKVVASSTSAVSGVLTLLGLTLVPLTAGVSLVLLATGMGLGAAAAVTSVSTGIVDHTSESSAKMEASHLVSTSMVKVKMVAKAMVHSGPQVYSLSENCCRVLRCIEQSICAIKLTKGNPALAASAKRLMAMGSISAQSGKQVKKALRGTGLSMSRRAWIMGIATTGVSLIGDVIGLVKESKHLHKRTKAKSAEELRQQAQELEEKLRVLTQIYDSLQSGSTQ